MGLIDQLKAAGKEASARGRESVQEAQIRHDLAVAYGSIGQTAFDLAELGAISHVRLTADTERIRQLRAQLAVIEEGRK